MIMIEKLPKNLRRLLSKYGIEGDALTDLDGSLLIEMDDLEIAFEIREAALDYYPCCLIAHPTTQNPSLLLHNLLSEQ